MESKPISVEAGRIYWGHIRDYVKLAQFRGVDLQMIESSGFLSREFTFKGSPEAMMQFTRDFCRWLGLPPLPSSSQMMAGTASPSAPFDPGTALLPLLNPAGAQQPYTAAPPQPTP